MKQKNGSPGKIETLQDSPVNKCKKKRARIIESDDDEEDDENKNDESMETDGAEVCVWHRPWLVIRSKYHNHLKEMFFFATMKT